MQFSLTAVLYKIPRRNREQTEQKVLPSGMRWILQALGLAASGSLKPQPQPHEGVTYAHQIEKSEAQIDWQQSAAVLERRIRAFNPFPGSSSLLTGEVIKLQNAHVLIAACAHKVGAGSIVSIQSEGVDVATGDGVLRITQLQKSGGKSLPVAEFLRGFNITPGMVFKSPTAAAQ